MLNLYNEKSSPAPPLLPEEDGSDGKELDWHVPPTAEPGPGFYSPVKVYSR